MNKKKPSKAKRAGVKVPRLVSPSGRSREHHFNLIVKTSADRKAAEMAVLCAFGKRQPDGCEFHLSGVLGHKDAWMDGARSGGEAMLDLAIKCLSNLRRDIGRFKRTNDQTLATPTTTSNE